MSNSKKVQEVTEHVAANATAKKEEGKVMEANVVPVSQFEPFEIGLCSGFNFGGSDFRRGLLESAWQIFRKERPVYIVLLGGLVDSKALMEELKEYLEDVDKKNKRFMRRLFVEEKANLLKDVIPSIRGVNLYIVTSPAHDGLIGEEIALKLQSVRKQKDIRVYNKGGDRFQLQQIESLLGAYVPEKASWRGDFYDTPGLRILRDAKKRSTRGMGAMNVVGCLGSSVFNPGDSTDVKAPYFLIPVLHKLSETKTSENQEGVAMLRFVTPNPKEAVGRTINFKDLLLAERSFIGYPEGATEIQKKVIDVLKDCDLAPNNIRKEIAKLGAKVDYLTINKELKALSGLPATKSWPGIFHNGASNRWSFHRKWFTNDLRYTLPGEGEKKDKFLLFGCLHAACKHLDMYFVREVMPKIIISEGITMVGGAGDFLEGMKHDLLIKGEIWGSRDFVYNYSIQENLAAYLIGEAFFKVFVARFAKYLNEDFNKLSRGERIKALKEALLTFFYIAGNHDDWPMAVGTYPLMLFRYELKNYLIYHIGELLSKHGVNSEGLVEVVSSKLIRLDRGQKVTLESGLSFAMLHPHMSRTKTPSIRAQEMLSKVEGDGCQIVMGANFHTAEIVNEWVSKIGQRVCVVIPTLKTRSGFEDDKLKVVDTGVGILSVTSYKGRIFQTEGSFRYTQTPNMYEANVAILNEFETWLKFNK